MRPVVFLLAALLTIVGCGTSSSSEQPDDCGVCAEETAALGQTVAAIDGVRDVRTAKYVTKQNITRPPSVRFELDIEPGTHNAVVEAIAEAGWKSRVFPLDVINVGTVESDAPAENSSIEYLKNRYSEYEAKWGPRPVG